MVRRSIRPSSLRAALAAIITAPALLSAGCGAPARPVMTPDEFQALARTDHQTLVETMSAANDRMVERVDRRIAASSDGTTTINILALSGGGSNGAFGAGVLVGWGKVTDPEWARPDFDVVTGVSTGAQIAPFAFIGTDERYQEVEDFYRNPKKDWIQERGLLFFLPSNPSFATIPGLSRDVRKAVDQGFVEEIAARSSEGKLLIISATDLDFGRQQVWDVGLEAEEAVRSRDPERVPTIMLASAAIPVAFPPISLEESIYADGGVTANVFVRLDPRNPEAFIPRWMAANPGKPLPKFRYWIIVNNSLAHIPNTVQERWPAIASPAIEISIRSGTLAEINWLAAEADFVNAAYGADIEVRVMAIPNDWRPLVKGSFKKENMDSLADLGEKMGADPASWQVWASPKDLPTPGAGR